MPRDDKNRNNDEALNLSKVSVIGTAIKPQTHKVFELEDIFDTIRFRDGKSDAGSIIRQNIIYILKRERLWRTGLSIIFPHGALKEVNVSEGFYQYDYSIYDDNEEDYIAHGTVFGNGFAIILGVNQKIIPHSVDADFEIGDMTLEICEGNLETNQEKELVIFS